MPAPMSVVLFDLGGVVVELGPVADLFGAASSDAVEAFWAQWLRSETVASFESGHMHADDFAAAVVDDFDLTITAEQFLANFLAWPQGIFDGFDAVLAQIPDRVVTATASNTNALHWGSAFTTFELQGRFDRHYPSFEVGAAKPSAEYFGAILADLRNDLGVEPAQVGFLDDNQINVDGARAMGIAAERVQGPSEIGFVLTEWRVL